MHSNFPTHYRVIVKLHFRNVECNNLDRLIYILSAFEHGKGAWLYSFID